MPEYEPTGVVTIPCMGIAIGISYILSIEEGLRKGKALRFALYPTEVKINSIKITEMHARIDILS
jgi:hypothetical protein